MKTVNTNEISKETMDMFHNYMTAMDVGGRFEY